MGCALFLLVGCEKKIVINQGEIGYLIDAGRLESIVIGRNDLIFSSPLQQVLIANDHYSFEVNHNKNVVLVCLSIDDPESFYKNYNGRYLDVESEISKRFLDNSESLDKILVGIHDQHGGRGVMIELCKVKKGSGLEL